MWYECCASKKMDSLRAEMAMIMVKVRHSSEVNCSREKLRVHILGVPRNMAGG